MQRPIVARARWVGSWARAVAAGLLLVAAAARAVPAQDEEEREAPEVEDVAFRGVRSVDAGELRESIATEESRCKSIIVRVFCLFSESPLFYEKKYLDETELRRDVLRIRVFYWRRGFRDAQVDTTVRRRPGEAEVTFRVTEGPPTRVSSITVRHAGDTAVLSDRDIERQMQLRAGSPLNLPALDSTVVLLEQELFDKGYADATVRVDTTVVDTARKAAAVRISVDPKWRTTVGEIRITGEENISERTIRRSITMKPGGVYRRSDILASQRNLYESNLFRYAAIVIPPQGDSVKLIEVTVREAPLNESRTSAGFNTIDFVQAEQRYTRYNFLGGARRLDLRGVVGNLLAPQLNGNFPFEPVLPDGLTDAEQRAFQRPTWQASADFTQPWLGSPQNSFGFSVFAHRRTIPGIVIDRGQGAATSFTRRMANRAPLTLSYRYELTTVVAGDVYFCQYFGVCELATIEALRRRQRLSPVALSIFTDRTNDLFYPTDGYTARGDAEHASTFTVSDFRYNRVSGEATKYWRVRSKAALAARVRAGWVRALESTAEGVRVEVPTAGGRAILHPRKRFYAGGSQSVRGYGENQLGPRVLTLDPTKLPEGALDTCTDASESGRAACAAILAGIPSADFDPRPTGGSALAEASVEFRFPIWDKLGGAVFVDGAFLGERDLEDVARGTGAVTPGFGARYYSPAGAIRVDLGIRPKLAEQLGVVTEVEDANGDRRIVRLTGEKAYDPLEESGRGFFNQILSRLTLHLSIGQAF